MPGGGCRPAGRPRFCPVREWGERERGWVGKKWCFVANAGTQAKREEVRRSKGTREPRSGLPPGPYTWLVYLFICSRVLCRRAKGDGFSNVGSAWFLDQHKRRCPCRGSVGKRGVRVRRWTPLCLCMVHTTSLCKPGKGALCVLWEKQGALYDDHQG